MALFKMRKGGDEPHATPRQPESIEAMRKRARHRLIGAGVLVLIGVIGFPVLFDTQPRPISVDIPIEIPDRNKVKPLAAPTAPTGVRPPAVAGSVTMPAVMPPTAETKAPVAPPAPAVPAAAAEVQPEAKPDAKPDTRVVARPEIKPEPKPEPKPEAKAEITPEAKAEPRPDDGAKARALLEGKPTQVTTAAAAEGRFVVQVGAYSDPAKARETRLKVERAGLKTYTHVAETKEGKRIRVRVGPFGSRAEADKAADKLKGLDLPAAILTL